MIDIERRICLNDKSENKSFDKTNLIAIAKEEMFNYLMRAYFIFHYILFQTSYMKSF